MMMMRWTRRRTVSAPPPSRTSPVDEAEDRRGTGRPRRRADLARRALRVIGEGAGGAGPSFIPLLAADEGRGRAGRRSPASEERRFFGAGAGVAGACAGRGGFWRAAAPAASVARIKAASSVRGGCLLLFGAKNDRISAFATCWARAPSRSKNHTIMLRTNAPPPPSRLATPSPSHRWSCRRLLLYYRWPARAPCPRTDSRLSKPTMHAGPGVQPILRALSSACTNTPGVQWSSANNTLKRLLVLNQWPARTDSVTPSRCSQGLHQSLAFSRGSSAVDAHHRLGP